MDKLIPKIRFPDFDRFWIITKLKLIADKKIKWSITGGPFGSNLKSDEYTDQGVRIIQLQNIGDGNFLGDYKIFTSEKKADELLSCNIYPNEIIISKMGNPVARACIIPNTDKRYLMASDGIRFVPDKASFNNYYIFLYINSYPFRKKANRLSTGSTRKRIGLSELKEISICHPSLPEQKKIATFLSAVDDKIQQLSKKKVLLEQYKKGLMQQIFSQKLRFKREDGGAYPAWEEKKLLNVFRF